MQGHDFNQAEQFQNSIEQQITRWMGAIPVLMPILKKLRVEHIVNNHCPDGANLPSGQVVLILVLNRLLAPRPLYKIGEWMDQTVLEQTLDVSANKLHDRRIGDALYPHFEAIWNEIVITALVEYQIDFRYGLYDITSIYFEGEYENAEMVDYGYSRDHRSSHVTSRYDYSLSSAEYWLPGAITANQ